MDIDPSQNYRKNETVFCRNINAIQCRCADSAIPRYVGTETSQKLYSQVLDIMDLGDRTNDECESGEDDVLRSNESRLIKCMKCGHYVHVSASCFHVETCFAVDVSEHVDQALQQPWRASLT